VIADGKLCLSQSAVRAAARDDAHPVTPVVTAALSQAAIAAGTGHSSEKPLWHARQPCCVNVTAHGHAARLPGGADARNITSPLSGVLAV
jgi:hypothetical protein